MSPSHADTKPSSDVQVEKIARRGGFGPVGNVHLSAEQNVVSLVMTASADASPLSRGQVAPPVGTRAQGAPGVTDAQATGSSGGTYVATARLRVIAKISPG